MSTKPVMLCSFPRSGRSWLRFMLAHFFDERFALGVGVDFHTIFQIIPNRGGDARRGTPAYRFRERDDVPFVIADHAPYSAAFADAPVVFVIRSPLDVLVSAYFYHTRRTHRFAGDLAAFLRDRDLGAPALVAYLKSWEDRLGRPGVHALSYEQLHGDAPATLARVLTFLGIDAGADDAHVLRTVDAARFANLREMELRSGGPLDPSVQPEPGDPQALRAREGKIGGYRRHLGPAEERAVVDYCVRALGPRVQRLYRDLVGESVLATKH